MNKMKKIINITLNNLLYIFTIKKFIFFTSSYVFLVLITKELFKNKINTYTDLIKFSFYGGITPTDLPILTLSWIAIQIIVMYIVLDFINSELNTRIHLTFLRIKNKKIWIISIFSTIFVCCFLYYLLGLFILGLMSYNLKINILDLHYSINILVLLTLTAFSTSSIAFLFTIILKQPVIIFTLIVFLYYSSIYVQNFSRYSIFGQGALAKHLYYNISFHWSYFYTTLFSIIMYTILGKLLLRRDI